MKRRSFLAFVFPVALAGCSNTLGDGDDGPDYVDASGDIEIRIDGESFDLSADRFQAEHAEEYSLAFHLHEFDDQWYMEGRAPVSVGEGIDLLPHVSYERVDGHDVLELDDDTYDEREGAGIEFSVNDDPVDPFEYVLEDGDSILVTISS